MVTYTRESRKRPMDTRWCSSRGGKLADVPLPHVRYYDDKRRKRYVEVEVMVYWGFGNHFYVKMEEDENPILDQRPQPDARQRWITAWDDEGAKGRECHRKFNTNAEAQAWIEERLATTFKGLRVFWKQCNVEQKWFYGEGD